MFDNILFPVDFSPSCIAMAAYVQRAAVILGAKVSLLHVVDLASFNSFELYVRSPQEMIEERLDFSRKRLDSFLDAEFPVSQSPRLLRSGDAAAEIAQTARDGGFNLIIMPTHSGFFRQMLLGSTTAKVLNDADCPVLTSRHAETIAPRPLDHRQWLCSIGLSANSERVLRLASQAAASAQATLTIIHAVQSGAPHSPIDLDLEERIDSSEREETRQRIAELQQKTGSQASVRIAIGSVKEALIEAARQSDADVLMIGRSPQSGTRGRMRDLIYSMVRDSPYPVLSI